MLRRFHHHPSSTTSKFLISSFRFCSSTSTSATESSTEKKKFDPSAWAKEQERRRQTEARKSFWTPSGATNVQVEIDQLEKQKQALLEQERLLQQEQEEKQQRPIWGRDTLELVERVQQQQQQQTSGFSSSSSSAKRPSSTSTIKTEQPQTQSGKFFPNGLAGGLSGKNPLTQRLDSLYKTYSNKEAKTKEAKDAIIAKRKEQLQWREIDYQLDQVRLDRDFVQWFNYLKYGNDYAVDCELERELRYFPEHVAHELKKNLKFLVGSSRLIKTGPAFPTMSKVTRLSTILDKATTSDKAKLAKTYEEDIIVQNNFKMPTVVFVSQLAHGSEQVEDIDRYYVPLVREAVSNPHGGSVGGANSSSSSSTTSSSSSSSLPQKKNDAASRIMALMSKPKNSNSKDDKSTSSSTTESIKKPATPQKCTQRDVTSIITEITGDSKFQGKFDVMYLKTADFQSSIWMRKWLTKVHATRINSVLASRTYVGVRMLRNFSSTLGLRNYGAQYVMLVDHQGKIRWLSTGPPTPEEVEWFQNHCRDLMKLHTIAKAK